jgi:predicted RNase H-like nuclease
MPVFIGIDLAWQSNKNHSGGAVLHGDQNGVEIQEFSSGLRTLSDVEIFICQHALDDSVVAIDAPLIIQNVHGQRPCETEIGQRFGAADASAHSTNQTLYRNAGSVQLARNLEGHGFKQCPQPHKRHLRGKWFFEVYPHSAHVVLFRRSRIIKDKKGRVASRKSGLVEFRENLQEFLGKSDPPLIINSMLQSFLKCSLDNLRGISLKHYEDKLDAILCAYLAAYFWVWSYERNEMIGNHETGYIINPKLTD